MNVAIRDTKSFEMSSIWSRVFVCAIVQGWLQVSVEGVIRCHDNVTLKRPGPGSSKEDGNSNEGIDKSCFGERWCTPSFDLTTSSRAPRPEEARASFYVYKSSNDRRVSRSSRKTGRRPKLIGIELSWSNKVSQMADITGYTINFHSVGRQTFVFDVCFNDVTIHNTTTEADGTKRVHFVYRYICENDKCVALAPGHKILVTIISLPGDFDVGADTAASMQVQIPYCGHKKMRKTKHCARRRHGQPERQQQEQRTTAVSMVTTTDNTTISSSPPSSTGIGLTTFSITLGGIAFSIAFIGWITWGLNANIGRRKRILFLEKLDEELDNPCSYAFQSLISEIRKHDLADITYNRWETVRLIADPITWIRNATTQSDIIVALASPQKTNGESCINLYFNEWINNLLGNTCNVETSGKRIALVSFHLKKQDSWPDLGNRQNLCKFKLPEELRKFYDNLFSDGPRKCPFSTDDMVSLANEANERTRPKLHKATKTVRRLLSIAGDESQTCLKK